MKCCLHSGRKSVRVAVRASAQREAMPVFKTALSPAMLLLMNERIRELTEQASLLPPTERAELVEGILQSLDATDPNLDWLWAEEAKDRLDAYRRGELDALDFDETLARHATRP
jgi:putative addiction module component (TIGR02574 family)